MNPLFWSIAALVMMICLIVIEMLTPSMGGFTLAALMCSGLSVYSASRHSEAAAFLMLALNIVLFPLTFYACFNLLRRSPIIQNEVSGIATPVATPAPGTIGRATTPLRPAGIAEFERRRVDVVTEGKFVSANAAVRVLRVEGATVVVEPV